MTEERKHAVLLATVILTARRLQPLLEEDDKECKPNMATEFWAEVYTRRSMERAAHILDLIDGGWRFLSVLCRRPTTFDDQSFTKGILIGRCGRVGQPFELGGAPFGVWYFKGCGLWLA